LPEERTEPGAGIGAGPMRRKTLCPAALSRDPSGENAENNKENLKNLEKELAFSENKDRLW